MGGLRSVLPSSVILGCLILGSSGALADPPTKGAKVIVIDPEPAPAPADEDAAPPRVMPTPLFYEVSGASKDKQKPAVRSRVYLLGSIHMGTASMYPLPEHIENAFAKCQVLVVEADTSGVAGVARVGREFEQRGTVPVGGDYSLRKVLPPRCWEEVKAEAEQASISPMRLLNMKPWYVEMQLEAVAAQLAGLKPELGTDLHFLNEAHGHKDVFELEGIDVQLDLFSDMSTQDQIAFLCDGNGGLRKARAETEKLVRAWRSGDADGIYGATDQLVRSHPDLKHVFQTILDDRNKEMADKMLTFFDSEDAHFVVVGAEHLVGPEGIVALLQAQGYTVDAK